MAPPANWRGPVFRLRQDYPTVPKVDAQPWRAFDPQKEPSEYLFSALKYLYEGNINPDNELSFALQQNVFRAWYHAPWQDFGLNGREFVHGMTRERTSEPGDLHPAQKKMWHNYAVGMYNAPGGYTIGRVWAEKSMPNAKEGLFLEGTVAAKLLFTTAPVSEVPYLRGAPEWTAYAYRDTNTRRPQLGDPRVLMRVRLLQIDIAVKDPRAINTGWIFGTFVYGGGLTHVSGQGWMNVHPVGLMWGNDPGYSGATPLVETKINPRVTLPHYGYQGRLNGPVDNRASSCLSCHSTAQDPQGKMIPEAGDNVALWFRNIKSGQPFDPAGQSLDYSLQLAMGIANFKAAQILNASPNARVMYDRHKANDPRPPRDGGRIH